jgi:hypothetical protein
LVFADAQLLGDYIDHTFFNRSHLKILLSFR